MEIPPMYRTDLVEYLGTIYKGNIYLLSVLWSPHIKEAFSRVFSSLNLGHQKKQELFSEIDRVLNEISSERNTEVDYIKWDASLLDTFSEKSNQLCVYLKYYKDYIEKEMTIKVPYKPNHVRYIITEQDLSDKILPFFDGVFPSVIDPNIEEDRYHVLDNLILDKLNHLIKKMNKSIDVEDYDFTNNDILSEIGRKDRKEEYYQLKSEMAKYISGIGIKDIQDLAVAIATSRSWLIDSNFMENKNSMPERMKPFVEDTNGVLVYQEQIIDFLSSIGADCFNVLKNLSKGINFDYSQLKMEKEEYDFLMLYAPKTFNKAHAVSSAYFAYLDVLFSMK